MADQILSGTGQRENSDQIPENDEKTWLDSTTD